MRSRIATVSILACAGLLLLAGLAAWAEEDAAATKPDPTFASQGRYSFKQYCKSCHGTEGKGDGPVAEYLRIPPADLTQLAKANGGSFPLEEVVRSIDGRDRVPGHGSPDMPVWGEAFQKTGDGDPASVEKKIRCLAHFVWTLQEKAE